jgi:dihydropteroate synthase
MLQAANFERMIWKTRRGTLTLGTRARVMGILNVTPDSFSDGGSWTGVGAALAQARVMIADGAEIIDIGGESTRPGAVRISATEEISRTVPILTALRQEWDGLISIDTSKAAVAVAALQAGADMVNDVTGLLGDPAMAGVCAASGCGVVVMHMQGTPETMQCDPHYRDVVAEVDAFFSQRLVELTAQGIAKEALCLDPGIGFGKRLEHNLELLRNLAHFSKFERPMLLGLSRKSFIGEILGNSEMTVREWPTVALTAMAREQGVLLHRVHSVKPVVQTLRMTEAILGG